MQGGIRVGRVNVNSAAGMIPVPELVNVYRLMPRITNPTQAKRKITDHRDEQALQGKCPQR